MILVPALVLGIVCLAPAQEEGAPDASDQRASVERPSVEEIRSAYRRLDYQRSRTLAHRALSRFHDYTREELLEVHRVLALVEISQNNRAEARRQFEAALSLDPEMQLDPAFVSPQILSFFDRVKRQWWTRRTAGRLDSSSVQYRTVPDRRVEAALRSIVLPGWGQHWRGERAEAWMIGGAWALALGGGLVADRPWRGRLLVAAGGVWVYAYLDVILSDPPSDAVRNLRLGAGPRSVYVAWRF